MTTETITQTYWRFCLHLGALKSADERQRFYKFVVERTLRGYDKLLQRIEARCS